VIYWPCTQLAENALDFFSDNNFQNLYNKNPEQVLRIIFPSIYRTAQGHWQPTVQSKGLAVMKTFMELNPEVLKTVALSFKSAVVEECQERMHKRMLWDAIADFAGGIDESIGGQTHEHIANFFGSGQYQRGMTPAMDTGPEVEIDGEAEDEEESAVGETEG
jgi:hypothetical protein